MPVTRGQFDQERQRQIARTPDEWHRPNDGQIVETVSLRKVGLTRHDRLDELRDQRRIHLPVAINLDHDVGAEFERPLDAGLHGAADTSIDFVTEHDESRLDDLREHVLQKIR